MTKEEVISKISEHYGIQRNIEFAKFFGLKEQIAVFWRKGKYNIQAVYRACHDINPEWLLSDGEIGEMLRTPPKETNTDYRELLEKSLENERNALARVSDEQAISKQVLMQTDKVLELIKSAKG